MKKLVLIACTIAGFVGSVFADTRFYDQNGFYQGRAVGDGYGNGYRFYDQNGFYQGRAVGNGNGYRYYDSNGFYLGNSH